MRRVSRRGYYRGTKESRRHTPCAAAPARKKVGGTLRVPGLRHTECAAYFANHTCRGNRRLPASGRGERRSPSKDPGVLAAAALRTVDDQAAARQGHSREAARDNHNLLA